MGCPLYLAMTAGEFYGKKPAPEHCAWMACHFSPYGKGLSNIPTDFPSESMLILNDWLPVADHSPEQISAQLQEAVERFRVRRLLLDLQRPGVEQTQKIVDSILGNLSCDIGVSEHYATENCAIFLPPVPQDMPIAEYLEPWNGRKIWLETDAEPLHLEITKDGCVEALSFPDTNGPEHWDDTLLCHYRICTGPDHIVFSLYRNQDDAQLLLHRGRTLGVECGVGLYQEYEKKKTALRL